MTDFSDVHIESSMPKPWERHETFEDVLREQLSNAPWLGLSILIHVLIFLIISIFPWSIFTSREEIIIQATIEPPPPEIIEEEEEEEEEIEEEEIIEDPVLVDTEVIEEIVEDVEFEEDVEFVSDAPFDSTGLNDLLGLGGGAGGKGGRGGGKGRARKIGGGSGTEIHLGRALKWLADHQDPEGFWDADGFTAQCETNICGSDRPDIANLGKAQYDEGLTGLALLAFLGDGHTTKNGRYRDVVKMGVKWLKSIQDDEGAFALTRGREWMYNHALATLAMSEAYYFSKSPALKRPVQKGIALIERKQNPYKAWSYDSPNDGRNDTSVSGWMMFALKSAQESGLRVSDAALEGFRSWMNEATDPGTGRVGYDSKGTPVARMEWMMEEWPAEKSEALTGVGLLCRFFLEEDPDTTPVMKDHKNILMAKLPRWELDGSIDMYYWYYASYAMFQWGGRDWDKWNKAMKPAVVDSQREGGDEEGSWDPIGPWGAEGGRVYSTATMALCLEVYFRYTKVLGGR